MGEPADSAHDRLDLSLADLKQRLGRGVTDRRSPFHTPTVATIGTDGRPRLRIVVLRAFDPVAMSFRFHTDARAQKVAELRRDARIALHFYDPAAKVQLRAEGRAELDQSGPVAQASWDSAQSMSRACYAIAPGPGTVIALPSAYALPGSPQEAELGRANFTTVVIHADTIEWLYLAHRGHRRALFSAATGWDGQWLAP